MDRHTPEQRSKNMKAVKSKGSKIETVLARALWRRGLRYRRNCRGVLGKPDFVFKGPKIAVFTDSEFWHGYNWGERKGDLKSNTEFWVKKIEGNIRRDSQVSETLRAQGWTVLRFWGKDVLRDPEGCADIVENTIRQKKRDKGGN